MIKSLIILVICHFTIDMFTGIWPIYKSLAELDLVKAGLIAMLGGIFGNMAQILFGLYGDRGYRKFFIFAGLILVSTACLYPYTNNYALLLVMVFCAFIGSSAFHPSGTGLVGMLTKSKKGLVISSFISAGTIGFAFSQIIFKKVYVHFNGNTLILLTLPAISLLLACFANFENDRKPKLNVGVKGEFLKLMHACKGSLLILYLIEVCLAAAIIGFIFILPEVMAAKDYESYWRYGGAHMLYIIGGSIIIIPAGHYSDKNGQKRVMFLSLIGSAILFYLFLALPKVSPFFFVPLMLFLGGAMGICNPVGVALGNRIAAGQVSLVSALLMGFAWGGGSFSTLLVGYLSKTFGNPITALYYLGIIIFIALILSLFLPNHKEVLELETAKS